MISCAADSPDFIPMENLLSSLQEMHMRMKNDIQGKKNLWKELRSLKLSKNRKVKIKENLIKDREYQSVIYL